MPFADHPAYRHDIGDDLACSVLPREATEGRVRSLRAAMAAMVVGVDLEALLRHHIRKPTITARMVHQPVANHQYAARRRKSGGLVAKGNGCAGGGVQPFNPAEGGVVRRLIHHRTHRIITQLVIIMGS